MSSSGTTSGHHHEKKHRSLRVTPKGGGGGPSSSSSAAANASSSIIATPPRAALQGRHPADEENNTAASASSSAKGTSPQEKEDENKPAASNSTNSTITSSSTTLMHNTAHNNTSSSSSKSKQDSKRISELEHSLATLTSEFSLELTTLSSTLTNERESTHFWRQKHSQLNQTFLKTDTDLRLLKQELSSLQLHEREFQTRINSLLVDREGLREGIRGREEEVRKLQGQVRGLKSWVSSSSKVDEQVADEAVGEGMQRLGNGLQNWVITNFRRVRIGMFFFRGVSHIEVAEGWQLAEVRCSKGGRREERPRRLQPKYPTPLSIFRIERKLGCLSKWSTRLSYQSSIYLLDRFRSEKFTIRPHPSTLPNQNPKTQTQTQLPNHHHNRNH